MGLPAANDDFFERSETTSSNQRGDTRRLSKSQKRQLRTEKTTSGGERRRAPPLEGRTPNQRLYLDALQNSTVVIASGEAGVGKTYLASRHAMRALLRNQVERIVITRPTASDPAHRLGFLPGDIKKKMAPWLVELFKGFAEECSAAQVDRYVADGKIEIVPFEMMRGRSIKGAVFILDEAQNCTLKDLRLFLTRTGEDTQVLVNGDPRQADIPNSGLATVVAMVHRYRLSASVIEFDENDVVRSATAKEWVQAFRKLDSSPSVS